MNAPLPRIKGTEAVRVPVRELPHQRSLRLHRQARANVEAAIGARPVVPIVRGFETYRSMSDATYGDQVNSYMDAIGAALAWDRRAPQLKIDGETIDCFRMRDNAADPADWDAKTYWPESALAVLNA